MATSRIICKIKEKIKGIDVDIYFPEDGKNLPIVCMLPGGSGKNYPTKTGRFLGYNELAEYLARFGFLCAIFDAHGQGVSDKGSGYSFVNALSDIEIILTYLVDRPEVNKEKIGLWGRCGGGIIAAKYAAENPEKIRSLALWGVPYEMKKYYNRDNLNKSVSQLEEKGIFVDRDTIGTTWNIEDLISDIHCPLLFIRGLDDKYFEPDRYAYMLHKLKKRTMLGFVGTLSHFGHEVDAEHKFSKFYFNLFAWWFENTLGEIL